MFQVFWEIDLNFMLEILISDIKAIVITKIIQIMLNKCKILIFFIQVDRKLVPYYAYLLWQIWVLIAVIDYCDSEKLSPVFLFIYLFFVIFFIKGILENKIHLGTLSTTIIQLCNDALTLIVASICIIL